MDCTYCEKGRLKYVSELDGYKYYMCDNDDCGRYYKFSGDVLVGTL